MNRQVANFQLKTNEGVLTGYNNSCTWNVDMSKILGDMYDKFEYFNLSLKCIAWDVLPAGTLNNFSSTSFNSYYMKGLQWENCNYDTRTNQLRDKSCIGTSYYGTSLSATAGNIYFTPPNVVNTFKKSTNIVELNISVVIITFNTPAYVGTNPSTLYLPYTIYDFIITPCKDYSETTCLLTLYEGILTNSGTTFTFQNINFEVVLGELWKQYDLFTLELVDFQSAETYLLSTNANSNVCNLEMIGLQTKDNKPVTLGSVWINTGVRYIVFNNSSNSTGYVPEVENRTIVEINKKNNIEINFKSIITGTNPTFTAGYIRPIYYLLLFKPLRRRTT